MGATFHSKVCNKKKTQSSVSILEKYNSLRNCKTLRYVKNITNLSKVVAWKQKMSLDGSKMICIQNSEQFQPSFLYREYEKRNYQVTFFPTDFTTDVISHLDFSQKSTYISVLLQ